MSAHGAVIPPGPGATVVAGVLFPLIGGVLVGLRFYARRVQRAPSGIEDWLTIPAFIFTLGMGFCLVYGVARKALAYPTPEPADPKDIPTFISAETTINRQMEYAILTMQIPTITCIKLSFLFFYQRIFGNPSKIMLKYLIWFLMFLCIAWGIAFLFSFVFVCGTHFSSFWTTLIKLRQDCYVLDITLWIAITDFVLDVVIFVFPMPLLWKLQMSRTRKFAVFAIFMVGGLTVAASITRMVIFVRAVTNLHKKYKTSGVDNLITTAGLYWTVFECGVGLIAACLPSCYVLFRRAMGNHLTSGSGSSSRPSTHKLSAGLSNIRSKRDGHFQLNGSDYDGIPLRTPVVRTDIEVHYENAK